MGDISYDIEEKAYNDEENGNSARTIGVSFDRLPNSRSLAVGQRIFSKKFAGDFWWSLKTYNKEIGRIGTDNTNTIKKNSINFEFIGIESHRFFERIRIYLGVFGNGNKLRKRNGFTQPNRGVVHDTHECLVW